MNPVTHVIFDMDGLLLDTETLYAEAYQKVLDAFGKVYTFEMQARILGCGPVECANAVIKEYSLPISAEEWIQRLEVAQREVFPKAEWMPGTVKLVHHLHKVMGI